MTTYKIRVSYHSDMPDSYTGAIYSEDALEVARTEFEQAVELGINYGIDKVFLERFKDDEVDEVVTSRTVEYPDFDLSVQFES